MHVKACLRRTSDIVQTFTEWKQCPVLCVGRIEATTTNLSSLSKVFEPLRENYAQCRRVESANSWGAAEITTMYGLW